MRIYVSLGKTRKEVTITECLYSLRAAAARLFLLLPEKQTFVVSRSVIRFTACKETLPELQRGTGRAQDAPRCSAQRLGVVLVVLGACS